VTPIDWIALTAISESIARVRTCIERADDPWTSDGMAVDAIAKRLEEIGELATRVTLETLARMPAVDWRGVKGMREILAHDYGQVQIAIIESVVLDDPDSLDASVTALLSEPPSDPG
jgi:uncharacterized protein with HEPN domain